MDMDMNNAIEETALMTEISWTSGSVPWPVAARAWGAAISMAGPHFEIVWSRLAPANEPANEAELTTLVERVYRLAKDLDIEWRYSIARPAQYGMALAWETRVTTRIAHSDGAWIVEIDGDHAERQARAEASLWADLRGESVAAQTSLEDECFAVGAEMLADADMRPRNRAEWLWQRAAKQACGRPDAAIATRLVRGVDAACSGLSRPQELTAAEREACELVVRDGWTTAAADRAAELVAGVV